MNTETNTRKQIASEIYKFKQTDWFTIKQGYYVVDDLIIYLLNLVYRKEQIDIKTHRNQSIFCSYHKTSRQTLWKKLEKRKIVYIYEWDYDTDKVIDYLLSLR